MIWAPPKARDILEVSTSLKLDLELCKKLALPCSQNVYELTAFHLSLQLRAFLGPPLLWTPSIFLATMCHAWGLKLALWSLVPWVRRRPWRVSMRSSISLAVHSATRARFFALIWHGTIDSRLEIWRHSRSNTEKVPNFNPNACQHILYNLIELITNLLLRNWDLNDQSTRFANTQLAIPRE